MGFTMTWVARTPNRKTGDVPSAYVGTNLDECRTSCLGCPLLDAGCYAWGGFARPSLARIGARRAEDPTPYLLETALRDRARTARAARIGVMGDPSRAQRQELRRAVLRIREAGLAILSYTHFWRDEDNQELRTFALASCEDVEGGADAIRRGWIAAVVLPWDHALEVGPTFDLPGGAKGFVCPAQTKGVTCNDCRMCSVDHPVWAAGKVRAVGFLDHSHKARRERQANNGGLQLPMFDRGARDVRTRGPAPDRLADCPVCGRRFVALASGKKGRPRVNCSRRCTITAAGRRARGVPVADAEQRAVQGSARLLPTV